MKKYAVINQKGGVGKTTITANLAHALSKLGFKVAIIDLDPQGHLAAHFGVFDQKQAGVDEVLLYGENIAPLLQEVRENLFLLPAGPALTNFEHQAQKGVKQGFLLKQAIANKFRGFDYLLMDCPPTSGLLMVNALFAADELLIPVSCDYLALNGLGYLLKTLNSINKKLKKPLKEWIVISRYHSRRKLSKAVLDHLRQYFPKKILKHPIREITALAESPGVGKTIFEFKKSSPAASDFAELAQDLIIRRTL